MTSDISLKNLLIVSSQTLLANNMVQQHKNIYLLITWYDSFEHSFCSFLKLPRLDMILTWFLELGRKLFASFGENAGFTTLFFENTELNDVYSRFQHSMDLLETLA